MRKLLLGGVALLAGAGCLSGMKPAIAQTAPSASPGSISVRLNGRVNGMRELRHRRSTTTVRQVRRRARRTSLANLRLYPGFDGVAANGLHYGAAAEIRINGGQSASDETLYVFQAYGYLGLPKFGQFSFGQQNGPTTVFETGTFEGFNDGGWNGDIEGMIPTAANPLFSLPRYRGE